MNEESVKMILKGLVAVVGFKLVHDWLQEEKREYTEADEIGIVDAYYKGPSFRQRADTRRRWPKG